jgi:hypothetical protein
MHAFLDQILDYAGLFPPATLPLDAALNNYLRYRKESPYRWLLGRFVCPTAKLKDLLAIANSHPDAGLLTVTALATPSPQPAGFLPQLQTDVRAIQEFRAAWGSAASIKLIEVTLPKGMAATELADGLAELERAGLIGFLEVPRSPAWRDEVARLAVALHSTHAKAGLKLRCGGVTADAFPGDADVAFFLARCNELDIPWKATAGLHHPRRHWDESLQVWHHGFLNVFCAGVLARTNALTEANLAGILADREGQHFHIEENRFAWKTWACSAQQVAEARSNFATTFGSCSFDEPVADLQALGLLDGVHG